MLFFVDAKVVTDSPLQIMKNRDELFMLFNIVYNSNTNRNNFIISSNTETTFAEFTGKEFDYVLLSVDTWTNLKFQPDNFQIVNNNYDYMLSADNNFVLLESVPKSEH